MGGTAEANFADISLFDSIFTGAGEYAMLSANPPLGLAMILGVTLTYCAYEDLQQKDARMGMGFALTDIGYIIGIIRCLL